MKERVRDINIRRPNLSCDIELACVCQNDFVGFIIERLNLGRKT